MTERKYELIVASSADLDFQEIMKWSRREFGATAADRYQTLLGQALSDLQEDPFRPGTRHRADLFEGIYSYHLTSSRERVAGDRVKEPRHLLFYRVVRLRVEVLRVLHESRDFQRHLAES